MRSPTLDEEELFAELFDMARSLVKACGREVINDDRHRGTLYYDPQDTGLCVSLVLDKVNDFEMVAVEHKGKSVLEMMHVGDDFRVGRYVSGDWESKLERLALPPARLQ